MSALERMLHEFDAQAAATAPSAARIAAARALRAQGLPTRRDENWHYANLPALESVERFGSVTAPAAALPSLPEPLPGYSRLLFVDGRLWHGSPWPVAPGIIRLPFEEAVAAEPATSFTTSGDGRLGLTARLLAPEALALRLAGTVSLEIISVSTSAVAGCHTDLVLDIASGAQIALVERRLTAPAAAGAALGEAAASLMTGATRPAAIDAHNLRLRLETGANLVHTRLQQTADHVVQHDSLAATVGEQASYRLRHVTAGGASARSSVQVQLAGREAAFDLRALAAARSTHVADAQFTILHEAPGTRSEQVFRGIASDRGHVACSADVQVAASAPGARVQQSLRGLIDGKGAEVDLRPRLTINNDDIQARHGATTGRLDENLLFYLLARGLEESAARSLLKWAFLGEALGAVDPPALRRAAGLAVAAQLSDTPDVELLQ
jgi:Fe-S cluster assembly protein SufD